MSKSSPHLHKSYHRYKFFPYNENSCKEYLQNPQYIKHLLENLILVTKINEKSNRKANIDDVFEHFKYNLKLVFLYKKLLPPQYLEEFENKYPNGFFRNSCLFDVEKFKSKHTINIKDSTMSFLERSI